MDENPSEDENKVKYRRSQWTNWLCEENGRRAHIKKDVSTLYQERDRDEGIKPGGKSHAIEICKVRD